MDPSLSIEAEFKGGKLNAGLERAVAAEDKLDAKTKEIARSAKQAEQDLTRFAKRTTEINATPAEKYAATVKKLDEALRRGLITQETHNRAVGRAKAALDGLAHSHQLAVGGGALAKVQSMAAGYLSVGAAVGVASQAIAHMRAEQEAALASLRGLTEQRGNLVQVATSQQDLAQMTGRADAAAKKYGVKREETMALMFDARSLGFEKDFETIAAGRYALGDLRQVKDIAGLVPTLFDKQISPLQALNMAGAAAESSRLDLGTLAPVLGRAAEGATAQGTSADELFALTAMMSQKYASGSTAADRISGFQVRASLNSKLKGKGVIGAVRELQSWSEEERKGFLKDDKETNEFYNRMTESLGQMPAEVDKIKQARQAAGTDKSWLAQKGRLAAGDRAIAAAQDVARAELAREITRENRLGVDEAGRKAAREDFLRLQDAQRETGVTKFAADKVMGTVEAFGVGERGTALAGMIGTAAAKNPASLLGLLNLIGGLFTESAKDQKAAAAELKEAASAVKASLTGTRGRGLAAAAKVPPN